MAEKTYDKCRNFSYDGRKANQVELDRECKHEDESREKRGFFNSHNRHKGEM